MQYQEQSTLLTPTCQERHACFPESLQSRKRKGNLLDDAEKKTASRRVYLVVAKVDEDVRKRLVFQRATVDGTRE